MPFAPGNDTPEREKREKEDILVLAGICERTGFGLFLSMLFKAAQCVESILSSKYQCEPFQYCNKV